MRFESKVVRAGEKVEEKYGAITTPIYQTTAFAHPMGDDLKYSRELNPTVMALEEKIAEVEGGEIGVAFSSGMAAVTTSLLKFLRPGKSLLVHLDMFGRTLKFCREFLTSWGVKVEIARPGEVEEKAKRKFDVVFVETISNPLLRVLDIEEIAKSTRENGGIFIADSTFATPINQKPLEMGAHIVVHSASKFIAGHNDVIAGLATGEGELMNEVDLLRRTLGGSLDPHAAYLVLRGFKTLKVRMEYINSSSMKIAEFLLEHPKVKKVFYPGLPNHPDHEVARKVLKGFGGVVSFEVKGGREEVFKVIRSLKLIIPAGTLGGTDSVISHPTTMSHRGLSEEERREIGIEEGLLRLSVGLENVEDIIEDIDQALKSIY